jgi:chromatin remodeling complex protein RSC6
MNKEEGTKIARTEVTRALVSYIKTNKLEKKENSKIISPDDKLKFLLGVEESDELTYFNMQKYMNKHFISEKSSGLDL